MNDITLPPAPNWYLASILACANNGTVAWGANNTIVVLKYVDSERNYTIIPNAHSEKVNSLAFSPEYGQSGKNLLVSGGDEHIIRIWDMDTMTAVSSQSYGDKNQTVIGVDWSKCDPTLICCISTSGYLISWYTQYSVCQTISLGKMTATYIACCPHKSNIVAIGTKNGLIYIVDLKGNGNIIYKMRGHDAEITSLSWCPIDINIFNGSNAKDLLLASGGKDRTIYIWKAGGDGRCEMQLPLPKHPQNSNRHRTQLGPSVGNFTVVRWVDSKYILASSRYGELLCVHLSMKAPEWKLVHGNHGRGIFSIGNVPIKPSEFNENWRMENKLTVWTIAQDRQVICSIIEKDLCDVRYSVPTHAGYIYCIASCPVDTARIAYGGGDAMLRLWHLREPHDHQFDVTNLWQKIMGRVTAIAWHPEQENVLAMGTSEGRIAIFDTNNVSKPPVIYQHHHRRTVYSLGWGINPSSERKPALYSCGDNELVYYEHGESNKAPTILIKKDCTEFSWKCDLSCIAIGYEDGSLSFLNNKLKPCGRPIFHLKKSVQCIVWHPDSTRTDVAYSPLRHYFAVGTTNNAITIFDMTDMMEKINGTDNIEMNEKDNAAVQYKVFCTLVGHVDRVVCLAWSPHCSGELVSVSFDSTAQVWNVKTQELIGTYIGHCGPIYSCMWSPFDPDCIFTGSADFSLRIWSISRQKVVIPQPKLEIKKNKSKKNKKKSDKVVTNTNIETITSNIENVSLSNGNIVNGSVHIENNTINVKVNGETKISHNKEAKNRNKKGNFLSVYRNTMSRKEVVLASCLKLAKKISNQHGDELPSNDDNGEIPTIFGTKDDVTKIINIEKLAHLAHEQHLMAAEMSIWGNNLRQQLQDAAKELRLNDFLVSLAPSLSVKMWQTMCEAYATQLVQESNPDKAVCYLLCIHKIREAIGIFLQSNMFREAYVLAKCKLEPDDNMLGDILEAWIKSSGRTGQFEEAAQCCIKLGDLTRAAKFLARRKDIQTLETAAELAILANNFELNESIVDDAVTESFLQYNFEKCRDLIKKFPILQYRLIHIEAADELNKQRKLLDESYVLSWLEERSEYGLLEILKQHHKTLESSDYNKLVALTKSDVPEKVSMLWMMISQEIALAAISPTDKTKIDHIVTACGILSRYEIMYPAKSDEHHNNFLIGLLSILNARCFGVSGYNGDHNIPVFKSVRGYVCLALLNWYVDKLIKYPTNKIPVTLVIDVIKKTLADGLDPIAVKYWTLNSEISKLETLIASSMGNSLKIDDDDDNEREKDPVILMERLEMMRNDKEKFIIERVCAPSPIVIYSKAIELCSLLTAGVIKNDFTKFVNDTWNHAVS